MAREGYLWLLRANGFGLDALISAVVSTRRGLSRGKATEMVLAIRELAL
jgi:hypothetical protein